MLQNTFLRVSVSYLCLTYNGRYNPDKILRWSLLSPFPKNILNWFASGQESLQRLGQDCVSLSEPQICLSGWKWPRGGRHSVSIWLHVNAVQSSISHNVIFVSWADKTFQIWPLAGTGRGDSEWWHVSGPCPDQACPHPQSPAPGPHVSFLLTFPRAVSCPPGRLMLSLT